MAKTELMIIGSRQRLSTQCDEVDIRIDDETIRRVDHTKSLGLTIDYQLSWSDHVDEICRKVSSAIGALVVKDAYLSRNQSDCRKNMQIRKSCNLISREPICMFKMAAPCDVIQNPGCISK